MPDYTVHLGPSVVTDIGEQKKPDVPSTKRLGAAAATRVGSGIIGGMMSPIPVVGTGAAFLTGAGGELLAQLLEEGAPDNASEWLKFFATPSRYGRAALEGGITALPGGAFVKGGRPVVSALRSGGIAAGGETIRQVVRGDEQFNPMAAGIAGLTGGLIGAAASPFVPRAAVVPRTQTVGTIDDLVTQAGQDVNAFRKGLPQALQHEGAFNEATPTALNAKASALDQAGQSEFAAALRDLGLSHGPWKPADILTEVKSLYAQGSEDAAKALADAAIKSRKGGTAVPDWLERTVAAELKATDKAKKAADALTLQTNQTEYLRGRLESMGFGPDEIAAALEKYKARIKPSINIKRSVKDPETGETITETINLSLRKQKEKGGGGGTAVDSTTSPTGVAPIQGPSDRLAQQIADAIFPGAPRAAGEAVSAIPVQGVGRAALTEGEEAGIKAADELAALTGSAGRPLNPLGQGMLPVQETVSTTGPIVLSRELAGAKPRYNVGTSVYEPQFVTDVDKAAYILAQTNPSKRDADYLKFVISATGLDEAGARELGRSVKAALKATAKNSPAGKLDVPRVWRQSTPDVGTLPVSAGPIVGGITPSIVPPVSKLSPETLKALMGRGISKEAAEAMTPEEALAQLTTPRTRTTTPAVTQPVAEIPVVLTAADRVPVLDKLNRELYPAEVADQLLPLQQRYHELADQIAAAGKPVKGTPEFVALAELKALKGKIGKKMSVIIDDAEDAGLIKAGVRNQWTTQAEQLLEDANANKIAEGIMIGNGMTNRGAALLPDEEAAMMVEQGIVPAERIGALTDDLAAGKAATAATDAPPTPRISDISPDLAAVDDKTATIRQALSEGKITQEQADAQAVQIAEEYLASKSATKPSEGGIIISAFGGGAEQLFKKHPEFGIKAALIAGGALTGAMTNEENPVLGALMGAGAGWTAGKVTSMLKQIKINPTEIPGLDKAIKSDERVRDFVMKNAWELVPHVQRAHFLMSIPGVPANVIAGPLGAGFFGALTKSLAGDKRGGEALLKLSSPKHLMDIWKEVGPQAEMLVRKATAGDPSYRAEVGGDILDRLFKLVQQRHGARAEDMTRGYIQGVGLWMTRADLTIRKVLIEAGFTEAEARVMTLTSEAEGKIFKSLMDFGRASANKNTKYDRLLSTLGATVLPFVRTPVNILEQGLHRLPGVGIGFQAARGVGPREIVAQQAVSSVLLYGSYLIGLNTSEENAKTVRRFVSNLGGQYSLVANLGFAAGQGGRRMGKSASPTELPTAVVSPEALKQFTYSMPFPEAGILENWGQFLSNLGDSDKPIPEQLPRGSVPALYKELSEWSGEGKRMKLQDLSIPPLRVDMPY